MSNIDKKDYHRAVKDMQRELVDLARWVADTGTRIVVLFEGRDSAGKGGAIAAIREHINPRQCRVVALSKPTTKEAGQWYFQRYVRHLPTAGEIVLFDRSWYNRAGVEQVMGFTGAEDVAEFLIATPKLEKLLIDDGIILIKYWLTTDQEKQEERFAERRDDPLKGWKLSPIDVAAREKYAAYTVAREAMLRATHTQFAPWTLVDFNDQKLGRLTLIRNLIDRIPESKVPRPVVDLPALETAPSEEIYSVIDPLPHFRV